MDRYPSTISSVALLIAKAVESYGCDSASLFRQAGMDPAKLRDPNARYPYPAITRLWKLASKETGDPCFGLTAAKFWHPTSLHALGYSWMASASLHDALERVVRYIRLVASIAQARLVEAPQEIQFVLIRPDIDPSPADEAIDAGMAVIMDMCRTSYGVDLNPLRVVTKRAEPECSGAFQEIYRVPIQFNGDKDALYFRPGELRTQLPTANPELARANDEIAIKYLARYDRSRVAMQVRAKLIDQLPSGTPTETVIAKSLHLSLRSLQRKLKEEGTTYKQLLNDTRRELATLYIKNSQLRLNEITYLLGFSESSNFTRAFKRWNGVTPSAYRVELR